MSDFLDFDNLARAVAPKLNMMVGMARAETTRVGLGPIQYRIEANGQGLAEPIVVQRDTAAAAVADLKQAVAKARRAIATENAINRMQRDGANLDEAQVIDIRRQLLMCSLAQFDQLVATLRHAALHGHAAAA